MILWKMLVKTLEATISRSSKVLKIPSIHMSLIAFLLSQLLGECSIWERAASGISFSLCDVEMEIGAGNDCSTREGISKKEEVLLFFCNKKKFELSGGRSRELIFGLSRGRCLEEQQRSCWATLLTAKMLKALNIFWRKMRYHFWTSVPCSGVCLSKSRT